MKPTDPGKTCPPGFIEGGEGRGGRKGTKRKQVCQKCLVLCASFSSVLVTGFGCGSVF